MAVHVQLTSNKSGHTWKQQSTTQLRRFGSRLVLTLWKNVLMTLFTWCASIFWNHKKRVQDGHQVSLFNKKQQPWFVQVATPDTLRCHCVGCREYVSYHDLALPAALWCFLDRGARFENWTWKFWWQSFACLWAEGPTSRPGPSTGMSVDADANVHCFFGWREWWKKLRFE